MNRMVPAGLLIMALAAIGSKGYANDRSDLGKAANRQEITQFAAIPTDGVAEETPNQRRMRLGQAIPEYAPAQYGEALETPNHRAERMRQAQETELARLQ